MGLENLSIEVKKNADQDIFTDHSLGWIPASNSEQWDGAGTAGEMAGGML